MQLEHVGLGHSEQRWGRQRAARPLEKRSARSPNGKPSTETGQVQLPAATAGKQYSGKFNLRVGEQLHEQLAIESIKVGESLNSYCVRVLRDEVDP